MMTKYGDISTHQIESAKDYLRKTIFYLLLYADPNEQIKYQHVDLNQAFDNALYQLVGFNILLQEPPELPLVMSYLEAARAVYNDDTEEFSFPRYRKLILDAGSKIMEVKVGDEYGDHS